MFLRKLLGVFSSFLCYEKQLWVFPQEETNILHKTQKTVKPITLYKAIGQIRNSFVKLYY